MRSLRDTNLPKFVLADFDIFDGLIKDLFPRIEAPTVLLPNLVEALRTVISENWPRHKSVHKLQPEDMFVKKAVNLFELFGVRHCVFLLGAAGSAKSEVWLSLANAQTQLKIGGGTSLFRSLNPKAVTSNELYGGAQPYLIFADPSRYTSLSYLILSIQG